MSKHTWEMTYEEWMDYRDELLYGDIDFTEEEETC